MALVNNKGYRPHDRREGFTMIELLVVIAIIALLAAIIFPVFATVQENARQSSSMSNLHDISVKMDQYKLDTQTFPPVLFGYYKPGTSMNTVLGACQADNSCSTYLTGLYPEYVRSWSEFVDPNNNAPLSQSLQMPTSTHLCATSDTTTGCSATTPGQLVILTPSTTPPSPTFYTADSYDWSPQLATVNSLTKPVVPLTRYETSWTSVAKNLDCTQDISGTTTTASPPPPDAASMNFCYGPVDPLNPATDPNNGCSASPQTTCQSPDTAENQYTDQLRWQNPPSNTYVTCTTYHVQQASVVLVLTADGNVAKVPANKFINFDQQPTDTLSLNDATNNAEVDGVQFWRISL